jgi:UvrB/uvrC motif
VFDEMPAAGPPRPHSRPVFSILKPVIDLEAPMSQDLRPILAGWDFDPDRVQVRMITGDDGSEKIQMRIDLGLMQMEVAGRPDGERPEGFESMLDYYESRQHAAATAGDEFVLGPEECAVLMREGLQYYHRYLSAFHLERFDLVARDTARNLRLFAFVVKHAVRQRDRIEFDRYRPYVVMMHFRARASEAMAEGDHRAALRHVDDGIAAIRRFLADYGQEDHEGDCGELQFLLQWRQDLEREKPIGPLERLEQQLEVSVKLENYEEAARIRDQIRRLKAADSREPSRRGSP